MNYERSLLTHGPGLRILPYCINGAAGPDTGRGGGRSAGGCEGWPATTSRLELYAAFALIGTKRLESDKEPAGLLRAAPAVRAVPRDCAPLRSSPASGCSFTPSRLHPKGEPAIHPLSDVSCSSRTSNQTKVTHENLFEVSTFYSLLIRKLRYAYFRINGSDGKSAGSWMLGNLIVHYRGVSLSESPVPAVSVTSSERYLLPMDRRRQYVTHSVCCEELSHCASQDGGAEPRLP